MRVGLFLAYWPWFSLEEQVELAVLADELGLDSVWISEAWGQDAVSVLGLLTGTVIVAISIALLVNFAAHPTMIPAGTLKFSADYVGVLKAKLSVASFTSRPRP
jgi:hypothetical protein